MLLSKILPERLWAEVVNTAVYVLNRTINTRSDFVTPLEMWSRRKPDISHLRTFGCVAFAHVPDRFRKKWDSKSETLIFVGYQTDSNNYRLFNLKTGRVTVSRNVKFDENQCTDTKENLVDFPIRDSDEKSTTEVDDCIVDNNGDENPIEPPAAGDPRVDVLNEAQAEGEENDQ